MKGHQNDNLNFVTRHYEENQFDTERALKRFHAANCGQQGGLQARRWLTAAAAIFAAAFVLFAGGYYFYSLVEQESVPSLPAIEEPVSVHQFVFDNTPLPDVLEELSAYYGCSLTSSETDKCLSASFPEDDLAEIVSAIETALDVDINIE